MNTKISELLGLEWGHGGGQKVHISVSRIQVNGVTCKENYSHSADKVTNIYTLHNKFNLTIKKGIIFNMWFLGFLNNDRWANKNTTLCHLLAGFKSQNLKVNASECTQLILIFIFFSLPNQHKNFIVHLYLLNKNLHSKKVPIFSSYNVY